MTMQADPFVASYRAAAAKLIRAYLAHDQVRAIASANDRRLVAYRRAAMRAEQNKISCEARRRRARSDGSRARFAYAVAIWREVAAYCGYMINTKCGEKF